MSSSSPPVYFTEPTSIEHAGVHDSDADRLAELGFDQELKRGWGLLVRRPHPTRRRHIVESQDGGFHSVMANSCALPLASPSPLSLSLLLPISKILVSPFPSSGEFERHSYQRSLLVGPLSLWCILITRICFSVITGISTLFSFGLNTGGPAVM